MKRSLVTLLALSFTFIFSFVYIKVFVDDAIVTSSNQAIVYYLQVGAFKSVDNANSRVEQLQQNGMDASYYFQDDLYFVITGVSLAESEKDSKKDELINKGFTCYDKQVVIQDAEIIQDIQNASYDSLLGVLEVYK